VAVTEVRPAGVAPGHDGQLAHPVGAGQGGGGHRVAGLVEGDAVAVLGAQDAGVALGAGHDAVDRSFEIEFDFVGHRRFSRALFQGRDSVGYGSGGGA